MGLPRHAWNKVWLLQGYTQRHCCGGEECKFKRYKGPTGNGLASRQNISKYTPEGLQGTPLSLCVQPNLLLSNTTVFHLLTTGKP